MSAINAVCGIVDYVAQPLAMLIAAPFLVRHMGLAQFGIWMLVIATVSSGNTLTTGFGDAALKYVSAARGENDRVAVIKVVRAALAINLFLGLLMGTILWLAAPYAVHHVFKIETVFHSTSIQALRIASLLLIVRSLESVFVSTLRAYERYLPSVRINVLSRISVILISVLIVSAGGQIEKVMIATLIVSLIATLLQAHALHTHVGQMHFLPYIDRTLLSKMTSFGSFSWLQAVSALAFSQADRLVIGAFLGTSAVAYYSVCIQAAQPIHGVISAGFHFLFPHLSAKNASEPADELRSIVASAFRWNILIAVALMVPIALYSHSMLNMWMGGPFASVAGRTMSILAVAFGLLAVNITGHYALLALGQVRFVTYINLLAGALSVFAMFVLVRHLGIVGAATARLLYGPVTWFAYLKLRTVLSDKTALSIRAAQNLEVAVEEVG